MPSSRLDLSTSSVLRPSKCADSKLQETLRMYPAESISEMMALEDTSLPLTYGLTTTSDEKIAELPIRKGQVICVAIGSYNRYSSIPVHTESVHTLCRLESIWGPDAHEFKPSRWLDGTPYTADAPHIGPYSNLSVLRVTDSFRH
jgi:cytochrome P450